jgi:hypothetical protein
VRMSRPHAATTAGTSASSMATTARSTVEHMRAAWA